MGRKGGGKKAFLKGVAKPDGTDTAGGSASTADVAESDTQQAAAPQAVSPETAGGHSTLSVPDHSLNQQQMDSETRGQLTQRQKKVRPWMHSPVAPPVLCVLV